MSFIIYVSMNPPEGITLTSAPYALRRDRRSTDMEAGMHRMSLYLKRSRIRWVQDQRSTNPLILATKARAMPMFPEVASMRTVFPGSIRPYNR